MLFQKQVIMETYQTYTKVDRRVTQILMYPSVNFSKRLFSANLVYSLSPPTSQPPHPAPECTRWSRAVGLLRTHRPRPAGLSRGSWRTNRLPFLLLLVSPALCLHQGYTKVTKSTEGITVWQAKLKLDTKNDQGEKNQTCPLKWMFFSLFATSRSYVPPCHSILLVSLSPPTAEHAVSPVVPFQKSQWFSPE